MKKSSSFIFSAVFKNKKDENIYLKENVEATFFFNLFWSDVETRVRPIYSRADFRVVQIIKTVRLPT